MTLSRFSGSFYVAAYLKARAEISRSRSLRASIVLHLTDPHPVPCPLSLAPYRSNESNTPRQFIFQNTLLSVFSGLFFLNGTEGSSASPRGSFVTGAGRAARVLEIAGVRLCCICAMPPPTYSHWLVSILFSRPCPISSRLVLDYSNARLLVY